MPNTLKITENSRGVMPIAVTPFSDSGDIDFDSLDTLMDHYKSCGVDGVTILGMMGEANKLSQSESLQIVDHVIAQVASAFPVIVGVSNPRRDNLVTLTKEAMERGASGVMITPAAGLNTETEVRSYFDDIFDQIGPTVPVCLQDYPFTTGVHMSIDTIVYLIDNHPGAVMLKHEDFPGLRKLSNLLERMENGLRRISVVGANAGLYYPLEMRRGADGVMTGFSYPEMLVQVFRLFEQGDADAAEDLYDLHLPILRQEYQPGIGLAVRKEILWRRRIIKSAATRQPGPRLNVQEQQELVHMMKRLEKKLGN